MKKRIVSLLLGVVMAMACVAFPVNAAGEDVVIEDAFPDPELQQYLGDYDVNGDGVLNAEEIASVTELDLAYGWVEDMTGIEYLTELKKIDLTWCWVYDIDVTQNTKLEELILSGVMDIMELDLSNNPALKKLDVTQTGLEELDLSGNAALEELNISLTYIEEIDLSNCKELVSFVAEEAPLTSVDFSNNSKLETVDISTTDLTNVDLSKLTNLKTLKASKSALTSVDVSNNKNLETLNLLASTGITALDVSNNTALKMLDISGTGITELSLANNKALEEFNSYDRQVSWKDYKAAPLKSLDLSNNTNLKKLYLDGSDIADLKNLDLTNMPSLTKVSLENTGLKSIKFNDNVAYEAIYLNGNHLAAVDRPALADGAKVEWGTQTVTAKVPSNDTLETFDLGSLVDIKRADVAVSDDIEYNEETGIVTFKGEKKEFAYSYSLDESGSYKMDVTVTVEKKTVEEEAAEKEAADKEAAKPVVDLINGIGTVTLESEKTITDAREAYDALTDDQKKHVENYDVLTKAEAELKALKDAAVKPEDGKDDDKDDKKEDDKKSDTVKTGDTAAIMPYLFAMAAALVVICKRRFSR